MGGSFSPAVFIFSPVDCAKVLEILGAKSQNLEVISYISQEDLPEGLTLHTDEECKYGGCWYTDTLIEKGIPFILLSFDGGTSVDETTAYFWMPEWTGTKHCTFVPSNNFPPDFCTTLLLSESGNRELVRQKTNELSIAADDFEKAVAAIKERDDQNAVLSRRYQRSSCNRCPKCDDDTLESGSWEADGTAVWREVECSSCGLSFTENFEFNNIEVDK